MIGVQFVAYAGELVGMNSGDARQRAHEVLDYVELGEARYRRVDSYSTGMKQRLKIASAIVHDPRLLILDEPTNGMDPAGREEILDLAKDLSHAKGMSLIFSSHLLPDVERVCDHVMVLGRGRLLAQGRIDELKEPHDRQFEVRVKGDQLAFAGRLAACGIVAAPADDHLLVQLPEGATCQVLWETANQAGEQVRTLRPRRSTLEEVFFERPGGAELMPILDQGYQHWKGSLQGHAWRWLAITRQGVRAQIKNRWVWALIVVSCIPALVLSAFLVLWGLFEQKSALLTPLLFLFRELPDELRAGPRGFRTTFWTLAFDQFLAGQVFTSMFLVLVVGPELISQDLRYNALPLYFSRPVRRLDYFAGKLGVIAVYLSAVMIVPVLLAYCLGVAFSLDPLVLRDTARVLSGSLLFASIVVISAGVLILAISSLSRNSRYVGALWIGIWVISEVSSGVLIQTIHRQWCPLLSYTANLGRVREALLATETARQKVIALFQGGQNQLRRAARPGSFGRRRGGFSVTVVPHDPAPSSAPRDGDGDGTSNGRPGTGTVVPLSLAVVGCGPYRAGRLVALDPRHPGPLSRPPAITHCKMKSRARSMSPASRFCRVCPDISFAARESSWSNPEPSVIYSS